MVKRKIILDTVRSTISYGYGELKKDVKTTSKKIIPKKGRKKQIVKKFIMKKGVRTKKPPSINTIKKTMKKKYKRKTPTQIKKSIGYGRQLNLGGLY